MKRPTALELIRDFDSLPDDAIVSDVVARLVLNESERSYRRDRPVPRIEVGPQRGGARVGDIRRVARGQKLAAT
jgi:hypothetical protein